MMRTGLSLKSPASVGRVKTYKQATANKNKAAKTFIVAVGR